MPENKALLDVQNLKIYFPVRRGFMGQNAQFVKAVDNVSFTIAKGTTLGLVGESGSGKTTLGRAILRAVSPIEGDVYFQLNGERVNVTQLEGQELRAFRPHMQMIFQDPYASLNPRMTVRDIIAEPLVATQLASGEELNARVRETAERCKLSLEHLRRFPHAFSGGQRQRIGIARALVSNPEFIVCDEPVSALDVSIQAEIINLLMRLQRELGVTYLFIAHDLSVVAHISDVVAVMYVGQIVEMAPKEELFRQPRHPYTEALLSAIPEVDPDQEMKPVSLKGEIPSPLNPPSGCRFHTRCPYVQEICKTDPPEWKEHRPGHYAACHFSDELTLKGAV